MAIISKKEMKKKIKRNSKKKKRNPIEKLIGGSNQPEEEYVEFFTNCNNEIEDFTYNYDRNTKITLDCTPLIDKLKINKEKFQKSIRDIFNSDIGERDMSTVPKENFLGRGSFKESWKVSENIALLITHFNVDPEDKGDVQGEFKGFYIQALFSKPIEDGGFGIKGIPMVYDFGKYEYEGRNLEFPEEGVYGFMDKGYSNIVRNKNQSQKFKKSMIDLTIKLIFNLLIILYQIHKKGYIHYDVKPLNILKLTNNMSDPEILLIDFGITVSAKEKRTKILIGSEGYLNPLMRNTELHTDLIDLFSVGITLLDLLPDRLEKHLNEIPNYHTGRLDQYIEIRLPTEEFYNKVREKYDEKLKKFFKHCFLNPISNDTSKKEPGYYTKEAIRLLIVYMKDNKNESKYIDFLIAKKSEMEEEINPKSDLKEIISLM